MGVKTFPDLSGGAGGGPAELTFPIVGPPGAAGAETFGFTTGGGLHGDNSGGVALSVQGFGDVLAANSQGQATLAGALQVVGVASLAGGLTTGGITAATLTATGNISIGGSLGLAGSAQLTGDLTARAITASAGVSAQALTASGAVSGGSLNVTGGATLASLSVAGTFSAAQIQSDGTFYFPTSSPNQPGVALADQHGSGLFAAPGSIGLSVAGQAALSFAANRAATFAGAVDTDRLTSREVATNSLQVSGAVTLQATTTTSLQVTAAAQVATNLSVGGDLTVTGTSRLASLRIDQLSTDHDLAVGGKGSIAGALEVMGATKLAQLTATGASSLRALTATSVQLTSLGMLGGPPDYDPVRRVPIANSSDTIDYVVTLDPGGTLALSGNLTAFGAATVRGAASIGGLATAGGLRSLAGLQVATAATFGTSLAVAQGLTAARTTVGGSTFNAGQGSPSGAVTGSPGDQYIDRQTGTLYLKLSGAATDQGWVPVTTSADAVAYPLRAPASQASAGPSYAFATSTGDGLGSTQAGRVYLAAGGTAMLNLSADTGRVSVPGPLTASDLTFGSATGTSASVSGAMSIGGQVTANSANLTAALSAATGQFAGALSAGTLSTSGDISSAARLIGDSALIGQAAVRAGTAAPEGQVMGAPGDFYLQRGPGAAWVKTTGAGNTAGWLQLGSGSSSGGSATITYPLTAPDGSAASPSYGFTQGGLGLTATGSQLLSGIAGGNVGWTLDASRKMTLAGALQVAGSSQLVAASATSLGVSGQATAGSLVVSGAATLANTTASVLRATTSLASDGDLTLAGMLTLSGSVVRATTAKPASGSGAQGDVALTTSGSVPLYVRDANDWRAVALVGDPVPTTFPLRGPADSAAAPNYASAASPNTGMYAPATGQIGWSTGGTAAGRIDEQQKWTLLGALQAQAATFASVASTGALTASGVATLGGQLNVTGAATFASTVSAGDITSSGKVTAQTATLNGLLSGQGANFSGDVSVGGKLTVTGDTTYAGVQRSGLIQIGDGTLGAPSLAFTAETGNGLYRPGTNQAAFAINSVQALLLAPAVATLPGALRVGGGNQGLLSPATNTLALQTAGTTALTIGAAGISTFAFQAQVPAGGAAAPGLGVGGAATGLYGRTDALGAVVLATSVAGAPVAAFTQGTAGTATAWQMYLGDPASTTVRGALIASAQNPAGNVSALGGALFMRLNGGAGNSLFVNEGTGAASSAAAVWAAVLTTSSLLTAAKFAYQAAAPAAVSNVGQAYSLSADGYLYYRNAAGTTFNLCVINPPPSNVSPGASVTTTAADNLKTYVNTTTTSSAVTLYTVPSGSDYQVSFVVANTGGFSITAPSGQVIYLGATATTASNITSTTTGSTITISNPAGAGVWFAVAVSGQWTVN